MPSVKATPKNIKMGVGWGTFSLLESPRGGDGGCGTNAKMIPESPENVQGMCENKDGFTAEYYWEIRLTLRKIYRSASVFFDCKPHPPAQLRARSNRNHSGLVGFLQTGAEDFNTLLALLRKNKIEFPGPE